MNENQLMRARANFKKLPKQCYYDMSAVVGVDELVVLLQRGRNTHTRVHIHPSQVDGLNTVLGVTKAQAAAMCIGSFGAWHTPLANPDNYNEDGTVPGRGTAETDCSV